MPTRIASFTMMDGEPINHHPHTKYAMKNIYNFHARINGS